MLSDEPNSPVDTNVKTPRPISDENFEIVQLDENSTRPTWIWADLLILVK